MDMLNAVKIKLADVSSVSQLNHCGVPTYPKLNQPYFGTLQSIGLNELPRTGNESSRRQNKMAPGIQQFPSN